MEQLVARQAHNLEVACSSPASATKTPEKAPVEGAFLMQSGAELGHNPLQHGSPYPSLTQVLPKEYPRSTQVLRCSVDLGRAWELLGYTLATPWQRPVKKVIRIRAQSENISEK